MIGSEGGRDDDNISDDDSVNMQQDNTRFKRNFTLLNTNARSLCPKTDSLVEMMEETEAVLAVCLLYTSPSPRD